MSKLVTLQAEDGKWTDSGWGENENFHYIPFCILETLFCTWERITNSK